MSAFKKYLSLKCLLVFESNWSKDQNFLVDTFRVELVHWMHPET